MGYSDEARKRAALGRSIKALLGEGAYKAWLRTNNYDRGALDRARRQHGDWYRESGYYVNYRRHRGSLTPEDFENILKMDALMEPTDRPLQVWRLSRDPAIVNMTATWLDNPEDDPYELVAQKAPDLIGKTFHSDAFTSTARGFTDIPESLVMDNEPKSFVLTRFDVPVGTDVADISTNYYNETVLGRGLDYTFTDVVPLEDVTGKVLAGDEDSRWPPMFVARQDAEERGLHIFPAWVATAKVVGQTPSPIPGVDTSWSESAKQSVLDDLRDESNRLAPQVEPLPREVLERFRPSDLSHQQWSSISDIAAEGLAAETYLQGGADQQDSMALLEGEWSRQRSSQDLADVLSIIVSRRGGDAHNSMVLLSFIDALRSLK